MDEKLYICNWLSCGKRFITLQKPQQHRYVHPSEKKYVCKECSNKFKCRVYLIRHQKKQEKQLLISNFSGYDQSQLDVTKSINHTFINLTSRNMYIHTIIGIKMSSIVRKESRINAHIKQDN